MRMDEGEDAPLSAGIDEPWGGFPVGTLCEVAGAASAGKTQLALALALAAVADSPSGSSALFISTDKPFPSARIAQMAAAAASSGTSPHGSTRSNSNESTKDDDPLARVFVLRVGNLETLHHVVRFQLQAFVRSRRVRLIVIDSIAACAAAAAASSDDPSAADAQDRRDELLSDRSRWVAETLTALKRIAAVSRALVLCINNVVYRPHVRSLAAPSAIATPSAAIPSSDGIDEALSRPCQLRPSASDLITPYMNASFYLDRDPPTECALPTPPKRTLTVIYAPHIPAGSSCSFRITQDGLVPNPPNPS